ncbi:hypothetical protein [Paraburkholderia ferrariae]|uniref:hypothetical protein n=1 Tax=Paraburkholderia ferrariae TaxID=386056 RepID=UPI0004869FF1|nr:hypothetical protein [Paraburkholderia ferrariae]
MNHARAFFDELNRHYLDLLRDEGTLYWSTHTGQSDAHDALAAASLKRKMFAGDASRLVQVREHLARLNAAEASPARDTLIGGLRGWLKVLEANATGSERAATLLSELLEQDRANSTPRLRSFTAHSGLQPTTNR